MIYLSLPDRVLPQCGSFGLDIPQDNAFASVDGKDLAAGMQASQDSQPQSLPQFPGESALKHIVDKWIETAESRLSSQRLLGVARGGDAPASRMISDEYVPRKIPQTHKDYEKVERSRERAMHINAQNADRRFLIEMAERSKLYDLVRACVESKAPMLAKELHTLCAIVDKNDPNNSFFDGPLAWEAVLLVLKEPVRTQADKDYYKAAEAMQLAHHLPDGCSADDYATKATAFNTNILPNLAQPYSDADAAYYLINLMPKSLRET